MGDFAACVGFTLGMEGGYSADPNDPGNWTGGMPGQGRLLGTHFGISAAAYPTLDIAQLTQSAAEAIYRRDYWEKIQGDQLPGSVAAVVFDAAVNNGPGRAIRWLQHALGVLVDGLLGPDTLTAARDSNSQSTAQAMLLERLDFMIGLADWSQFGAGWGRRLLALAYFSASQ